MKLYLSSCGIPTPDNLAKLLGKPLSETSMVLIPNAQDYYNQRAWTVKVNRAVAEMESLGFKVTVVDLRLYGDAQTLQRVLQNHDLIWVLGGNTFVLRYQMRRSGFEDIITDLLEGGIVYGGDSAGALAAGLSIAGIESADDPEFAEEVIENGLCLVPFVILPHVDNPEFADVVPKVKSLRQSKKDVIELTDSQAVIFDDHTHRVIELSPKAGQRTQ